MKTAQVDWGGDVGECAFTDWHQQPVAPVGASGEIRGVVFPTVEEETGFGVCEAAMDEDGGGDAHVKVGFYDAEAGLVVPGVFLPATGERVDG